MEHEVREKVRRAVLYFRFHRDNPHATMESRALAEHLAALGEHVAREGGMAPDRDEFVTGEQRKDEAAKPEEKPAPTVPNFPEPKAPVEP